jgi:uncharacterized FAD-dependent dehydrogenase
MTVDSAPATRRWRVSQVIRELGEPESVVFERACRMLGATPADAVHLQLVKRSIDARGKRAPRFEHIVEVELPARIAVAVQPSKVEVAPAPWVRTRRALPPDSARPVVIGMGPCGLFAALQLAEAGLRPVVIDRGKPVEERSRDVARLMGRGEITENSNLCFGEGGAGTWSDGKLYTRVGGPLVREVLESLVEQGAPDRILVDGRPHLGTDRLVALLKAFRATLRMLGCELRFDTVVERLQADAHGQVTGVVLSDGEVIPATHVIAAPGHSARDFYEVLARTGVHMTPKAFAVGFRIEHPQALIDEIQYTRWADHPDLPAAYYEITTHLQDAGQQRGVYSFCMCPGGSVVPTPTREGEVCVNGMSHAARSGRYANSAMVVTVDPSDFAAFARSDDPVDRVLAGVAFQQSAEAEAWALGGGAFVAPAQRAVDYLAGRVPSELRRTTYKRGVQPGDLRRCYPPNLTRVLQEALRTFEGRMPGYLSEEAVLIGVETRTSAPVTIVRDRGTLQSVSHAGLYPAGEGAGYGGGIVSAAIDGLRAANAVLDEIEGRKG